MCPSVIAMAVALMPIEHGVTMQTSAVWSCLDGSCSHGGRDSPTPRNGPSHSMLRASDYGEMALLGLTLVTSSASLCCAVFGM